MITISPLLAKTRGIKIHQSLVKILVQIFASQKKKRNEKTEVVIIVVKV